MASEIGDLDDYPRSGVDSAAMILSCPNCATGYSVGESEIKEEGRRVRCAACGARWTAYPAPPSAALEAPARSAAPPVHASFRARETLKRRWREAALAGVGVGGAAAALALIAGLAVVYREDVVRSAPPTAGVYAVLGLPVNRVGLVIDSVRAEPALQDGHAALAVEGEICNVTSRTVASPPLRIALFDAAGRRLAGRIATAPNVRIAAGGRRRFAVAILDPPLSASNLEVGFAAGPAKGGPLARPLAPPAPGKALPLALKGPMAAPPPPAAPPRPAEASNAES